MEDLGTLINGHDPVLVDFLSHKKYEANCTQVLGQVKDLLGEGLRVVTVDVKDGRDLITALGLHIDEQCYCTLMLFRNGRVLWREKGLPAGIDIIKNIVYTLR
jgi:hypothetical protein